MRTKLALSTLALLPILGVNANAAGQNGVIDFELVNVRVNPNINESVSDLLKKGDKVEIISEKDGWTKIKSGKKTGWIPSKAIKKISAIKKAPRKAKYLIVSTDGLNFRTAPSTSAGVMGSFNKGTKLKYINKTASWTKVEYKGKTGYVSTRFLQEMDNDMQKSELMKVISNDLSIRKDKTSCSVKLKNLKNGDKVEYLSSESGWSKVRFEGIEGFVSSHYIEPTGEFIEDKLEADTNIEIENIGNLETNDNLDGNKTSITGTQKFIDMGMSLEEHVDLQLENSLNVSSENGWKPVEKEELMDFMNPDNFMDEVGIMQFAVINRYTNDISVSELNSYLDTVCHEGNVFHRQGAAFIKAAKKNNINVMYLVAHSLLETANGNSKLARGIEYKGTKVYNFFGIGAVDGNAVKGGTQTAYEKGWTSIAKGIDGAAEWIGNRYLHNGKFQQDTLYSMKWSTNHMWHQYASDISWPSKIGEKMGNIGKYASNLEVLSYKVPNYR